MSKIRVMICDDSSAMRRILCAVLSKEEDIEVVYQAQNGLDAVNHLAQIRPEVVVLDVEMPVMDGIEAVAEIRKTHRSLPIVMFSSLTAKGAEATLDAVAAGANEFATKPTGVGHVNQAMEGIRADLVVKIRHLVERRRAIGQPAKSRLTSAARPPVPPVAIRDNSVPASVVVIGSSTGGPEALKRVLQSLTPHFDTPILIVQHMPEVFTGLLAERLNASCHLRVQEATDNAQVRPGDVWLAKGGYHMELHCVRGDMRLKLNQAEKINAVRPSVDPLFRSAAKHMKNRALGVILTGMGKDGLDGCRALSAQGSQIITQDEATSSVWGMPRAVLEAGLSNEVLPLDEIGAGILARSNTKSLVGANR